ncbi:hypothetical protein L226DRAFT_510190 [Lentinus tigrinus ALCF2SS1-7]|uniref:Ricin B lectin domain-containing protein n=1 Tax=Lentinus tigrinus ALCF2SS1-6 TaxID=1328759 RepID=A0A5C2S5Q2_9APHY|nr:hypothetical protein L227DRAFT_527626 [Lentinus tigrinus ALCF2SS1-6]RPD73445.1 hypothetical protein L226DRAFT_510190 [Lentinus tigrinus ALCF2SS1-7]
MAAAPLPTYARFIVLDPDEDDAFYTYPNYVDNDARSDYSYTISIYRGLKYGQTVDNFKDDGGRYVFLGKDSSNQFMREEDFKNRFVDQALRKDFDRVQAGDSALFPIWTANGQPVPVQRNYVLDIKKGETFEAWATRMKESWVAIYQSAGKFTASFNVYARFFQPASYDGFELVFTPSENEVLLSQDDLKKYVAAVMTGDDGPKYPFRVLTYNAAQQAGLVLLSSSFYGFYHTWISAANFERVFKMRLGADPIARPWPRDVAAATVVDKKLKTAVGAGDGIQTSTLVTADKIDAANSMRRMATSQKTVMGDVSATEVAAMLWPANTLDADRKPSDAEWLHRSAFHFGGLGDKADYGTSQCRANLVFGTGECNTDMIRGENAVSTLASLCVDSDGGTLITQNIVKGNVRRRMIDGSYASVPIEPCMEAQRAADKGSLLWLCMNLKYQFTMMYKDWNINFNSKTEYDPFSRYLPFRVEARLDDNILADFVKEHADEACQPPKKRPALALAVPNAVRSLGQVPAPVAKALLSSTGSAASNPSPTSASTTLPSVTPAPAALAHRANAAIHLRAVASGASSVDVHGVKINSPTVLLHVESEDDAQATSSPDGLAASISDATSALARPTGTILAALAVPPEGFTLVGDVNLFGVQGLAAKMYSWHGPVPPNVVVGADAPIYDQAVVDGDFKLSNVLPKLQSTPFDKIVLHNVTFTHQNYLFDTTKPIGWDFGADYTIDPSSGMLYDVLRTVLKVQEPTLHLDAGLGLRQDWNTALKLSSFTLSGTFPGLQAKICDGLMLTSVGAELLGIRSMEMEPRPHSVIDFGFGVFGTLAVSVPSSITPLELDYRICEIGGVIQLVADLKGKVWRDPLGIKGLVLNDVCFTSDIVSSSPMKSLDFQVSATFQNRFTAAVFTGSYAAGAAFSLSAVFTDFDLTSVFDIFESLTSTSLAMPDVDVKIGSASITVASGTGLTIDLQDVEVEGHTAADATLIISAAGVTIRGDVTSSDAITFGEVELKSAFVEVTLQKGAEGSSVALGGEIEFEGLVLDAIVHLYKGTDNKTQWTAYASLTAPGDTLSFSKLVPALEGSFLDLALSQVVFVAASQDDPFVPSVVSTSYAFRQGVQLCAILSPIAPLDSLLRSSGPTSGLTLSAGWSKATGFQLDVRMPETSVVHFGRGIVSDPFTLRIQLGEAEPSLLLIAGLKVPVQPKGQVLDFHMSLGISPIEASATAQMDGYWIDPFGIGQAVKIGPNVALSIDIIFAQFLTTGTPSGFGIVGGLAIGKASASFAMEINEDPMREVLSAEVKNLDVNDVVSFANVVTGLSISQPPDFLDFEDVKLYICPNPTTIGTIAYPQGFSFQAAMTVFGKHADIACAVGSDQVTIKGGVDNFVLGPLVLRGIDEPRATVDVSIGPKLQHILVDGSVTFFDKETDLHVEVQVMPSPIFTCQTRLMFTELLLFDLDLKLVGALSLKTLENADFEFYADMEQHILEYVRDQVDTQFSTACAAANEGFETAQRNLQDAKAVVKKKIDDAQADLDKAEKAWDTKRDKVTTDSNNTINAYNRQIEILQKNVATAQRNYDIAMANARAALQKANNDRAAALKDAQLKLENAKKSAADAIRNAENNVKNAEDKMNRDFGNAERSIQDAQNKVNSLQSQINSAQHDLDHAKWYDKVKLGLKLAGLKTAKVTADGVLDAAKAVVHSAGYIADETALNAAKAALTVAQNAAPGTIAAAQGSLEAVDKATAASVTAAERTVEATEKGSEFVALQGAQAALSAYKSANDAVFKAATDAINELTSCAEYIAFQAAQGALATAKAATSSLDGLQHALDVAQSGEELALNIGKYIADHATGLVDIQRIELSGSLRGMIGVKGDVSKPFVAHVEYVLAGHMGTYDGQLDLRETAAFITEIFKEMWSKVSSVV